MDILEQIETAFDDYEKLHRPKGADQKKYQNKTRQLLGEASFAIGMDSLLQMLEDAEGHEILLIDAPEGATGPGTVVYKD